jgi:hydroxyacylglutathione hydrolase
MLGSPTRFIEGFAAGMWQTNCYLVGDLELGTCVVVDPGQDAADVVVQRLEVNDVRCEAILLTHGHIDHIWSVPELARKLDVPALLHVDDHYLWDDPGTGFGNLPPGALKEQFGLEWDPPAERLERLRDAQSLSFAGLPLIVRHTPGHTPGSCVFVLTDTGEDEPLLLSGDLIFNGSVGRTDFPRGSHEQLLESIRRVVLPLEDRTVILSGHGRETTVGRERAANPFVRDIS